MSEERDALALQLARLEVKIDQIAARDTDHETRLRVLERRMWSSIGASSVLSSVLTAGGLHMLNIT